MRISVAHTPDADDAFMFYAMISGRVADEIFEIENVVEDIESLNKKAFDVIYDVTAISVHGYAYVCDKYRILSAGASVGDGYGPILVSAGKSLEEIRKVGIPGRYTTASLLLRIALNEMGMDVKTVEMRFDEIAEAVLEGKLDAGVLIHEGQITYAEMGLKKILDLWEWWNEKTSLSLPLGVNVIRRSLNEDIQKAFLRLLMESVKYAIENPDEATAYAMRYGRGMSAEMVKRFAMMYVNGYTLLMPPSVVDAMDELFGMAEEIGVLKKPPLDILYP